MKYLEMLQSWDAPLSDRQIERVLAEMPMGWAMRWCGAGECGCLGCANRSGGLAGKGVTKEQWARILQQMTTKAG